MTMLNFKKLESKIDYLFQFSVFIAVTITITINGYNDKLCFETVDFRQNTEE